MRCFRVRLQTYVRHAYVRCEWKLRDRRRFNRQRSLRSGRRIRVRIRARFRNVDDISGHQYIRIFKLRVCRNHVRERNSPRFAQLPKRVPLNHDVLIQIIRRRGGYRLRRMGDFHLLPDIDDVWIGDLRVGCDQLIELDAVLLGQPIERLAFLDDMNLHCLNLLQVVRKSY